ncbi:hypothetical protein XENTR_v10006308 [Xenopus tropicalis]|uniref:LOC100145255 protein n=1 Tax=Xenopus tropicalis TaxID=8364 RepID=B0JZW0_XENTR|nr:uncharacterized protein LOC100145255 [Xenopus tropicalis]AAI59340.1 LOC100145255 protein [Xenopus tropicalis]KAE8625532.1 hypothetical protein XENTR_v10006308 [Xenopus tropicalis]|eukprot:NP_001120208.1 uncharacterized protein LOC100145255 [Xenopus tropicalis]
MASLLQDILYEVQGQAPAPNKDFHHLIITKTQVILRSWKISVRAEHRKVLPREVKKTHSEFLEDSGFQKQVQRIFGKDTVEYVLSMCRGNCDFIVRLPDDLKIRILSFLDTNDIKNTSETCRAFQKLCSTEEFWEKIKARQEKRMSTVSRLGFPGSLKIRNTKQMSEHLAWMQRRRSTLF